MQLNKPLFAVALCAVSLSLSMPALADDTPTPAPGGPVVGDHGPAYTTGALSFVSNTVKLNSTAMIYCHVVNDRTVTAGFYDAGRLVDVSVDEEGGNVSIFSDAGDITGVMKTYKVLPGSPEGKVTFAGNLSDGNEFSGEVTCKL